MADVLSGLGQRPVFTDRAEAGRKLAEKLMRFKDERPVILALPRGGVPVGLEIAKRLEAPLDLVFVRKIGVPFQPELAIGAVADGGHPVTVVNEEIVEVLELPDSFIETESSRQLEEIERRKQLYLGDRPRIDFRDRTTIVVDDGIATGATTGAALKSVRHSTPSKLVLAVPAAPPDSLARLSTDVDETVCLEVRADFGAVGAFYVNFEQVTDEKVAELLKQAPAESLV